MRMRHVNIQLTCTSFLISKMSFIVTGRLLIFLNLVIIFESSCETNFEKYQKY